jgi:hypothetical protein
MTLKNDEFNYYGSSFKKEDLEVIQLAELKANSFCPGHLFFYSSLNNKLLPIKRAGEILEPYFFEKYQKSATQSFYILKFLDLNKVLEYKTLWNEFKLARLEKDKIVTSRKIAEKLKDDYCESKATTSILNFISATFDHFNKLSPDFWLNFQDHNFVFFQRSLINASFSMAFALMNGFYDYKFLRDIFSVIVHLDYSFINQGISFNLMLALEEERKCAGNGVKKLKETNSPLSEVQLFIQHPKLSYDFAKKSNKIYDYPEVIEYIKFHHEKNDGSGFPYNIGHGGIASWESLIQFGDNLFPYQEIIFSKNDGHNFLSQRFLELKNNPGFDSLPLLKILKKCEYFLTTSKNNELEAG